MIHKLWPISPYSFCSLFNRKSSVMFGLSLAAILTVMLAPVRASAQTTRPTDNGTPVHNKKSILRMKTAVIDCAEAKFLFVVAICIVLS